MIKEEKYEGSVADQPSSSEKALEHEVLQIKQKFPSELDTPNLSPSDVNSDNYK